ncbi:MAG: hypothetical protein Q8933_01115 [Bacteroidota bacterium]|nr:hypothetical protein [Bacteroidota bacterium]MDP4191413.1 hypothetical protein [Bacteroidota bacterium]MDP4193636.1 hypothetical protein [Bacteroidota bacterium]
MIDTSNFRLIEANEEDILWVSKLETSVYSINDAVPLNILQGWYRTNPKGFYIAFDDHNNRVGHIDILPVKPTPLDNFVAGYITEQQIKPEDIYTPGQKEFIRNLYIESLALKIPGNVLRAKALLSIISEIQGAIRGLCEKGRISSLYAISASKEGRKILEHLGFQIYSKKEERIDKHDLFRATFSTFMLKLNEIVR